MICNNIDNFYDLIAYSSLNKNYRKIFDKTKLIIDKNKDKCLSIPYQNFSKVTNLFKNNNILLKCCMFNGFLTSEDNLVKNINNLTKILLYLRTCTSPYYIRLINDDEKYGFIDLGFIGFFKFQKLLYSLYFNNLL